MLWIVLLTVNILYALMRQNKLLDNYAQEVGFIPGEAAAFVEISLADKANNLKIRSSKQSNRGKSYSNWTDSIKYRCQAWSITTDAINAVYLDALASKQQANKWQIIRRDVFLNSRKTDPRQPELFSLEYSLGYVGAASMPLLLAYHYQLRKIRQCKHHILIVQSQVGIGESVCLIR